MDSQRVRAYLQVACAGLGFDIGEVWWTSNETNVGPSSSMASETSVFSVKGDGPMVSDTRNNCGNSLVRSNTNNDQASSSRRLRFVQLYTSKSYENRRSELVNPPTDEKDDDDSFDNQQFSGNNWTNNNNNDSCSSSSINNTNRRDNNLQEHVLSPRLVDAIAQTAQVVWANSKRPEDGLIGRSDIKLQTAVGMPVAVDDTGNMCVVVMFSPNHIQSTDDAIEYLQSISRSATTSSIPCLLPVFETTTSCGNGGGTMSRNLLTSHADSERKSEFGYKSDTNSLGEGVTARFLSFDNRQEQRNDDEHDQTVVRSESHRAAHNLSHAPKDTFGIPMLPSFAELGNPVTPDYHGVDVFDEASYGIWNTIMMDDTILFANSNNADRETIFEEDRANHNSTDCDAMHSSVNNDSSQMDLSGDISDVRVVLPEATMQESRKIRLEEFCVAFLDMSVFDLADVWVPAGDDYPDCLRHVTAIASSDKNTLLDDFQLESSKTLVKYWMGAVGRAFSSGNPVWSANPSVFVDPGRSTLFQNSKILTVLAVPVFSAKSSFPSCVVACYSLVRSGSVPFVLKFVQQALRLLWDGLDTLVEPHDSVGRSIWDDVAPADLGEMAADVEMQHHFLSKKRPHSIMAVGTPAATENHVNVDSSTVALASHLQSVSLPNGDTVQIPFLLPSQHEIHTQASSNDNIGATKIPNDVSDAFPFAVGAIPFTHVLQRSGDATKQHVSAIPARPLVMPHSFPTAIISSGSFPIPCNMNAAIFVFPHAPMVGMKHDPIEQTSAPIVHNVSSLSTAVPNHVASTMDSKIYCMNVNERDAAGSSTPPSEVYTMANKRCRIIGCDILCVVRRPYCVQHSGTRICEFEDCNKCAQASTRFCIAHGGGRRCTHIGCDKGARDKFFCAAHGGGKRCRSFGCDKSAVGGSTFCTAHGGGRRCDVQGCDKSAQSSTRFCVKHGGGKKCAQDGCEKVARGRTQFCAAHGGGVRCKLEGCNRVAIGKLQLCRAHGGGSRIRKNPRMVVTPTSVPLLSTRLL